MTDLIWNQEAEEAVLGAMLISDKAADKAVEALEPEYFFLDTYRTLFRAMKDMRSDGIPVDLTTVGARLDQHPDAKARLHTLVALIPTATNILHYASLVRDCWAKRLVDKTLNAYLIDMSSVPADEAIARLEGLTLDISTKVEQKHELVISMQEAISDFEARLRSPEEIETGVPVPWKFLEPLQGGRLYIIGGYQGDGKTAAMLQFVSAACEGGKKVGLFSVEMGQEDLFNRWMAERTGVKYGKIRTGNLTEAEMVYTQERLSQMDKWRVDIIDDEALTVPKIRKHQRAGRYEVVFIDHLHQMEWADRKAIETGVKQITSLAREWDMPVVLLAQLSRSGDWQNPYPLPTPKSLRESGMIDALASHIWFIHRNRDKETHLIQSTAKFIIAKNRFGPTSWEPMDFDERTVSFSASSDNLEFIIPEKKEEEGDDGINF